MTLFPIGRLLGWSFTSIAAAALSAAAILPVTGTARAADAGSLTIAIASDPVTLDPGLMASFFEVAVQYNIHEALVHQRPDLSLEPGLAAYEMADPLTYRFTLRPGLTFHDGTPIDAAAAKFNLERLMDPKTGSPRRAELEPIDTISISDPLTFVIKLKRPFAALPQILALRAGMLVSPTALARLGPDFAAQAAGAGPYRVERWTKNAELVLKRFDGYWRGKAPIETLIFRPLPDETARLANLRAGTVQLIDGVPAQSVAQLTRDPALTLKQMAGLGFDAFSFNLTRAPFSDLKVRKAFAMAIDLNVINRAVYFGTGVIAHGAVPPSVAWAYNPGLAKTAPDPGAALDLLRQTGVPLPVEVAVTVINSPTQIRIAEILQAQAAAAGFKVDIRRIDLTSLITVLRQRDFDLAFSPWSGRSDPDGNMFSFFAENGVTNFSGYQNTEVTSLLRRAREELDEGVRGELYREAQTLIARDLPMLFIAFPALLQASVARLEWTQYPDGALHLFFARFS